MQYTFDLPVSFRTKDTAETENIGRAFAEFLSRRGAQAFVAMYGDLGVGKTAFVRGFCSYFGNARVKSPTFSIVNEYRFENTSVISFLAASCSRARSAHESVYVTTIVALGHTLLAPR